MVWDYCDAEEVGCSHALSKPGRFVDSNYDR